MQVRNVENWDSFEQELEKLRQKNTSEEIRQPLLFRGQSDSRWSLQTTLERNHRDTVLFKNYYRLISVIKPEIETFTDVQWSIPDYTEVEKLVSDYDPFSLALTFGRHPAYEYMAYLRHHGFPSPLLDWTRSPFVAAYFAFSKTPSFGSVSIYVLSEAKIQSHGSREPGVHRLGPHIKTHRRHFLQQSEYTMCLIYNADSEWLFDSHDTALTDPKIPSLPQNFDILKFNIPCSERLKVLKLLDERNLNAFSLFGSEESLMETMALRKFHLS